MKTYTAKDATILLWTYNLWLATYSTCLPHTVATTRGGIAVHVSAGFAALTAAAELAVLVRRGEHVMRADSVSPAAAETAEEVATRETTSIATMMKTALGLKSGAAKDRFFIGSQFVQGIVAPAAPLPCA